MHNYIKAFSLIIQNYDVRIKISHPDWGENWSLQIECDDCDKLSIGQTDRQSIEVLKIIWQRCHPENEISLHSLINAM